MNFELTKAILENAFDLMGQIAVERGLVLEIAVYGGSCLILGSNIVRRQATLMPYSSANVVKSR